MGCNCGDNEYEIIVDNNGSCEPTTPEYYITLNNVGVDGFSPIINQVNVTSSSFQLQITDVNGTETTGDIPLLSYLDDNFVTNSSLADTLTAYVTSTSLSSTLTNYVTNTSLATTLEDYVTNSVLSTTLANYVTSSTLSSTLSSYVTNSSLSSTLSNYATISALSNYVDLSSAQTITGAKTFNNIAGINVPYNIQTDYISNSTTSSPLYLDVLSTNSDKSIIIGGSRATFVKIGNNNVSEIRLLGTTATLNSKTIATTDQIPTVNNKTITLTQGGVTKGSFTLNQSTDDTIDLDAGGSITNPLEFSRTYDDGEGKVTTATLTLGLEDTGYPYPKAIIHYEEDDNGTVSQWNEYLITNSYAKNKGGLKNNYISSTYSIKNQLEVAVDNNTIKINASGELYANVSGGTTYTAGTGIDITNDTISIDTSVVAQLSDIPDTSDMATQTWVGNQGYLTSITSSDVTTALGYTPYNSTNPNGYTSNVGTVTSVNNVQPDANGNVTISTGGATIDDTTPSATTVYSSQKTQDLIDALTTRISALENGIDGGNA